MSAVKWSGVQLAAIPNPDGTFGGVIVASLDLEHFTKFYGKADLASSGSISLIGTSMASCARPVSPAMTSRWGKDINGTEVFAHDASGVNGEFNETDPSTGQIRLVALRKVNKNRRYGSASALMGDEVIAGAFSDLAHVLHRGAVPFTPHRAGGNGEDIPDGNSGSAKIRPICLAGSEDPAHRLVKSPRIWFCAGRFSQCGGAKAASEASDQFEYALLFLDLDRFKLLTTRWAIYRRIAAG